MSISSAVRRWLSSSRIGTAVENFSRDRPVDDTPDAPRAFGYKTSWFAVRWNSSAEVAAALGGLQSTPANWQSGLTAAERPTAGAETFEVFVTPAIEGWTLIMGSSLPYPDDRMKSSTRASGQRFIELFKGLSSRFPEVYFFGSYRVVDFVAWARADSGKIERMFAHADGETLANVGQVTDAEISIDVPEISGLSLDKAGELIWQYVEERGRWVSNEENPARIAKGWGTIDPRELEEMDLPLSAGTIVKLRK